MAQQLLSAAHSGDVAQLASLLHSSPELINVQDNNGFTPLALAAEKGHLPVVRKLLADWNIAAATTAADLATDRFVAVDAATSAGNTPLMWAAARGHLEVLTYLLHNDAECLHANETGDTSLMWAAASGHANIVALLIRHHLDNSAGLLRASINVAPEDWGEGRCDEGNAVLWQRTQKGQSSNQIVTLF